MGAVYKTAVRNRDERERPTKMPHGTATVREPYEKAKRQALKKVLFLKEGSLMLNITKDIQSLTTFRRRSGDFMKQLKKSKRPVVLTVKGKAQAVVQDAEAYQRLLDIAARADVYEGIRQGLEQARQGKGRGVDEFFDEFEAAHGISR
jgi:prevent-host-death family protein